MTRDRVVLVVAVQRTVVAGHSVVIARRPNVVDLAHAPSHAVHPQLNNARPRVPVRHIPVAHDSAAGHGTGHRVPHAREIAAVRASRHAAVQSAINAARLAQEAVIDRQPTMITNLRAMVEVAVMVTATTQGARGRHLGVGLPAHLARVTDQPAQQAGTASHQELAGATVLRKNSRARRIGNELGQTNAVKC